MQSSWGAQDPRGNHDEGNDPQPHHSPDVRGDPEPPNDGEGTLIPNTEPERTRPRVGLSPQEAFVKGPRGKSQEPAKADSGALAGKG